VLAPPPGHRPYHHTHTRDGIRPAAQLVVARVDADPWMWRRVGGGAALMAPGSLPQRLPLVGNREWVAMRAWRGEDTSPGRSRVFREYPNPKCRVPDLLGSIFLNLVSGSSF
jgi:hypothetical protein